ncbi:hypothetical protein M426DRAFT_10646 [Hypoxylon sp. CI-4A]|nr:hypothetical protein M426DRAFT_10646 [Hypoxylon sp. CI-4A]
MASKTTYIPRYLLPQYGALWRTATRTTALARPLNGELGQVLVRYASRTSATKIAKNPAAKIAGSRAASTKSTAAKAAKASAPTKPPTKTPTTKPAPKTTSPSDTSEPAARQADPSKPIVLEKPERFNPPSHGARLPRSTPRHYGGVMSEAELQAQSAKAYPGMPPPENTWTHWFLNSRGIHMFITLGTLTSLALYTFMANFNAKSPFADMIPPISELPRHPFQYLGVVIDVMKLHEEHESALTAEKRKRRVEDVAKRNEYRKAHGMEPAQGFWAGGLSSESKEDGVEAESQNASTETVTVPATEPESTPASEFTPDGKRKKFLGIF